MTASCGGRRAPRTQDARDKIIAPFGGGAAFLAVSRTRRGAASSSRRTGPRHVDGTALPRRREMPPMTEINVRWRRSADPCRQRARGCRDDRILRSAALPHEQGSRTAMRRRPASRFAVIFRRRGYESANVSIGWRGLASGRQGPRRDPEGNIRLRFPSPLSAAVVQSGFRTPPWP